MEIFLHHPAYSRVLDRLHLVLDDSVKEWAAHFTHQGAWPDRCKQLGKRLRQVMITRYWFGSWQEDQSLLGDEPWTAYQRPCLPSSHLRTRQYFASRAGRSGQVPTVLQGLPTHHTKPRTPSFRRHRLGPYIVQMSVPPEQIKQGDVYGSPH